MYVADSTVRAGSGIRFKRRDAYLLMLQEGLKIMPETTRVFFFSFDPFVKLFLIVNCSENYFQI